MEDEFKAWGATYLIYQEEIGESGTHHFQGYIEMPKSVRFTHFGMHGAHFEKAHGSAEECKKYCSKEETRVDGPYEFGTISRGQGSRADIIALRDAVKVGKTKREIFEDDSLTVAATKFSRGMEDMFQAFATPVSRENIRVVFHYGPPGTGKTFCCHHPDAYYFDGNSNGFWNGYKGQDTLILDEFSGRTLPPLELQRVCDMYPLMINVKGGSMPCKVCILMLFIVRLPLTLFFLRL